jgi:hypothetical protein
MGSSDMDGSISATKESLAGYWDQHAVELVRCFLHILFCCMMLKLTGSEAILWKCLHFLHYFVRFQILICEKENYMLLCALLDVLLLQLAYYTEVNYVY